MQTARPWPGKHPGTHSRRPPPRHAPRQARQEWRGAGVSAGAGRPAGRRYAVYLNNVAVSLTEALATGFPAVAALLGEESAGPPPADEGVPATHGPARRRQRHAPPRAALGVGGQLERVFERPQPRMSKRTQRNSVASTGSQSDQMSMSMPTPW